MCASEVEKIKERYKRRLLDVESDRYSFLQASVWQSVQERQRAILGFFSRLGITDLSTLKVLEAGCGTGGNLLDFLRMGFRPENMRGIELLEERVTQANELLPRRMVEKGNAGEVPIEKESVDVLLVFGVFSSLLDNAFQEQLAANLWQAVRPGGGVLWYDLAYNNPANPDVRGVTRKRIRQLFPEGKIISRRVTLAPPISRLVTRLHPAFYGLFNSLPLLRSHILCWIGKSAKKGHSMRHHDR